MPLPGPGYTDIFYLQDWKSVQDPFWGTMWQFVDGVRFEGILGRMSQSEFRLAEAQGLAAQFTLMVEPNMRFEVNDYIRSEDDTFYKVTGLPRKAKEPAESQFWTYPLELSSREAANAR